jgi:hypothetical protein
MTSGLLVIHVESANRTASRPKMISMKTGDKLISFDAAIERIPTARI